MAKLLVAIGLILALWCACALGDLHGFERRSLQALNNAWSWYKVAAHHAERASDPSCQRSLRLLSGPALGDVRASVAVVDARANPLAYAATLPLLLRWQPRLGVPEAYRDLAAAETND